MPKQSDIRVQIPGCTTAHFWDVVYERPEATERYHTSFNASTSTSVTPWLSCQRTINFTMPLKLPDFLKRMVGLDSVAVTEIQRVVWHGGGAFTVTSETNITNMLGAGQFTTALQLTVTEQQQQGQQQAERPVSAPAAAAPTATTAPASTPFTSGEAAGPPRGSDGGCAGSLVELVYSVRCAAASIPWPMSATIENVMSEKALVSMQTFLDFCTQLLEEQAVATAAAAAATEAATPGAASSTAPAPGDAAALAPTASAALLPPSARASESGTTSAAVAAAGGPWVAGTAPVASRISLRHRWPSITCSQDLGVAGVVSVGINPSDPFKLHRADTLGTAGATDVFWDAPENFASAGSASGISSSTVSPRQMLLQSNHLRRLSGDTAPSGGGAAAVAAASAVTVNAVATETHQVAVAVDRLTAAVAALDGKVAKLLLLQEDQQQQLRYLQQIQQRQQQQQDQQQQPPGYTLDTPTGQRHGRYRDRGEADVRSDVRWMFRVTLAVLLATLLIVTYWLVHPFNVGFRPHSGGGSSSTGGGGSGGGGGSPPEHVPVVSVLRLNSSDGGGGSVSSGGGSGGQAGVHERLALQVPSRLEGTTMGYGDCVTKLRGKLQDGGSVLRRTRLRRRQRQQPCI